MVVSFNGRPVEELKDLGVELLDQTPYRRSLSIEAQGCSWKLYPPRIRHEAHELVVDNDVVFHSRCQEIDDFLNGNHILLAEAYSRNFGEFDSFIPADVKINSGLYGLPPKFDFGAEIERQFKKVGMSVWDSYFGDQGLVATLTAFEHQVVPRTSVQICHPDEPFQKTTSGWHFIGLNKGWKKHWETYLSRV
jgi:hypothetical protein